MGTVKKDLIKKGLDVDVREHCEMLVENPQRSPYARISSIYKDVKDDYPDEGRTVMHQSIGVILLEADYTSEWGERTYKVEEDKL